MDKAFTIWIRTYGASRLSRDFGMCLNTVQRWANGTRVPSPEVAKRLVKFSREALTLEMIYE